MDNLAHSLAGAALGQAGLKKKTALGMATLIIAANLPDVDVLGLLWDENLAWRRGWTHGPLAMLLLPPILVGLMLLFDQWQSQSGRRPQGRPPLHIGWLLALAYIGWLTHPLLDFMNSYGIRLLMPFSEKWFYGDVLFIIDPWLWMILAWGVFHARYRRHTGHAERPALYALVIAASYMTAMGLGSLAAVQVAGHKAQATGLGPVRQIVANPVPLNPFRRDIIVASDSQYIFAHISWLPRYSLVFDPRPVDIHMDHPALKEARRYKAVRDFLYWSRLPFAHIETLSDSKIRLTLADARYSDRSMVGPFVQTVILDAKACSHQSKRASQCKKPYS